MAKEEAYRKGRDYALFALRLDPEFVAKEKEDFRAAFERCVELDERHWGAGPRRALANFLALNRARNLACP